MRIRSTWTGAAMAAPAILLGTVTLRQAVRADRQETQRVPRTWDDREIAGYRMPLAGLGHAPRLVSEHDYYALPENNLKTYPVYAPDAEPPGYMEMLKQEKPQPMVDISSLKTDADWIAAGREVFYGRELPRFSGSEHNLQLIRDPNVLKRYNLQRTKDGVLLGLRYVVREQGKVELGTDTCAMCHVQVRDGKVIEGAPNIQTPFGPLMGDLTRIYAKMSPQMLEERRRRHMREDYRVPYLKDDPNLAVADLPAEKIAELYDAHPLGVHGRTNTSLLYPVKIANLIGIKDIRFFDRTATSRNRGIADLMRYCGLVADVSDALTHYGEGPDSSMNVAYMGMPGGIKRTPDPLLYALARYIYSLKEPENPNKPSAESRRGEKVFRTAGCASCHTPPLFTNNKLTLAEGYEPTGEQKRLKSLMPISVGTDPGLALKTRKGTGTYRVPSLRMLWLNGCFLHNGSIGTLEELFDSRRLQEDFRSSNWAPSVPAHAVKGHPFGLELSSNDRRDLVAYLKTL